ncbi:2-oxo acid dehydrogenase subunit E2 [Lentzea sp. NPDC004782]|uniref:2-oxo acid dehydrogenase subunit E2 n=1 Tax=Lentzea sp. NPDC004782 TaxID=3154458 RepID=UPI0033B2AE0B
MITEIKLKQEGANDESAVVLGWFVEDGQRVDEGDVLLEVETSKVTVEIQAPSAGYVVPAVALRHEARVGEVVAYVCADEGELADARARRVQEAEPAPEADGQRVSPAALRYAQEHGVELSQFAGQPVVTLQDVQSAGSAEPLSRAKELEVRRLAEANVLNAAISVQFEGAGVREFAAKATVPSVRLLATVVHSVASALAEFPNLNSWFDNGIRTHESIDVGIAIDLDDSLKVGVVHEADRLDLDATERRLGELVSRYLNDELTVSDVTGGGVTISDLSMEDVLSFQPLLNHGQALAIGLGGDRTLPGAPICVTATFDHRVTTGREVSQFLNRCRHLVTGYGQEQT